MIFITAVFCASYTSLIMIPGFVLIFLIPQFILLGLQCCDMIHNWEEFRETVGEEACEKVSLRVLYKEKISGVPFEMILRVIVVMLEINPDRAGPSFVIV